MTASEKSGEIEGPSLGIWELAWPAILNNLLFSLIGLVSIKMVGNLGPDAVAAVATGQRVFLVYSQSCWRFLPEPPLW